MIQKPNKYKKTNIPWMEKIPEHWKVRRLKVLGKISTSSVDKKVKEGDKIVSLVNYTDVYGNKDKEIWNNPKYMKVSANPTQTVVSDLKKGDVLFTPSSETIEDIGICSVVMEDLENTLYSYHLVRLRFYEDKVYNNYKKYMFNNPYVQSYFSMLAKGSTRKILDLGNFKNLLIPIPSIEEQTAIANYLDKKCKEIKTFITKKQTFIKLLKEQRQSVIDNSVTKGLDKNVKLKNTGIDWLGDIPEHWEVRRLASFGKFSKGSNVSKGDLIKDQNGEHVLLYGDIYTKYEFEVENLINRITKETAEKSILIMKGDLLFTGSGEDKAEIGKCIVYTGDKVAYAGGDVIIFRQNEFDSRFISYSQNTNMVEYQKYITSKGDIIVHTYSSKLKNVVMPFPPTLEEQAQIITHIKTETAKIDQAIAKAEKEIGLIQEYQKAMIAEAVLGKIMVND